MSMELLGNEFLDVFYSADETIRARRDHLEGIVEIFPWIATVDAFQHWIYSHPGHTPEAGCYFLRIAGCVLGDGLLQGDVAQQKFRHAVASHGAAL